MGQKLPPRILLTPSSDFAATAKSVGARGWSGLLRVRAGISDPTQSGFYGGLSARQRRVPRSAIGHSGRAESRIPDRDRTSGQSLHSGAGDAVDAILDLRARRSVAGAEFWCPGSGRRIFATVHFGDGDWNVVVWIRGVAAVVSSGLPVRGTALGAVCDDRDLVGQFAAGVHVLQSVLVARALGI